MKTEIERARETIKMLGRIVHDMTVANQAAWIEWKHGKGAEAAMVWVHNGLVGPGHIPDESEPWAKEAQAYYSANCADPMPTCYCGRPSHIGWMGKGFCSDEHYQAAKAGQSGEASNG